MKRIKVLIDELDKLIADNQFYILYYICNPKTFDKICQTLSKLDEKPDYAEYFIGNKKDLTIKDKMKDYLNEIPLEKQISWLNNTKSWLNLIMYESTYEVVFINEDTAQDFAIKNPICLWLFDYGHVVHTMCKIVLHLLPDGDETSLCIFRITQLLAKFEKWVEPIIVEYCKETKK